MLINVNIVEINVNSFHPKAHQEFSFVPCLMSDSLFVIVTISHRSYKFILPKSAVLVVGAK